MPLQAKPIKRLYTMEDELVLSRAQTMHGNLTIDIAVFQAKFPWIDLAFLLSFQTDITTALNYQQDAAVLNLIKVLTEDLNASVDEGMKALDALDIYARLAYPDSPAKQRIFGQDNWDKARTDQQKMFKALELAYGFANSVTYKPALLAKGMAQTDIDSLNTVAQNITLKDNLQELAKSGRPITTEDRIKVFNTVWQRQQTISTSSELAWRDDAEKRAQYLLYPQATQAGAAVLEADVASSSTQNIDFTGVQTTPSSLVTIEVAGATLRFFASATAGGAPGMVFYDVPVSTVTLTPAQFATNTGFNGSSAGAFLNVGNNTPLAAHYKITITNIV